MLRYKFLREQRNKAKNQVSEDEKILCVYLHQHLCALGVCLGWIHSLYSCIKVSAGMNKRAGIDVEK